MIPLFPSTCHPPEQECGACPLPESGRCGFPGPPGLPGARLAAPLASAPPAQNKDSSTNTTSAFCNIRVSSACWQRRDRRGYAASLGGTSIDQNQRPESTGLSATPISQAQPPPAAALLCCPPARSLPWVGPEFGARPSTPLTTPSSPRPSSAFAVGLSSARPSDDRRMLSSTARPSSTLRGGCPWSPGSVRTVPAASKAVMTSRQRLGGADRLGSAARKDGFSAFPWLMSHFLRSLLWGARRFPGRGTPGAQVWTRSLPRWPGVQAQRAEAPALRHDCHTLSAGHVFTC